MATHDYVLENQPGKPFRDDLNACLEAIRSSNLTAVEPVMTWSGMLWADTATGEIDLKLRNAADNGWLTIRAAAGLPEAPTDGVGYLRRNASWQAGYLKAEADAKFVPVVGGSISPGSLTVNCTTQNTAIVAYGTGTGGGIFAQGGTGNYGVDGRTGAANAGGVIGWTQALNAYGILGHANAYAGYFNGLLYCSQSVRSQGVLYSPGSAAATTGNSPNVWQNSSSGNYARSTSSLDYKVGVEPLWDEIGDAILKLRPIWYRSGPNTIDRPEWSWCGFGAEEVVLADFHFATWSEVPVLDEDGRVVRERIEMQGPPDEDGNPTTWIHEGDIQLTDAVKPESVNLNAMVAALVNLVQRQNKRIEALEAAAANGGAAA